MFDEEQVIATFTNSGSGVRINRSSGVAEYLKAHNDTGFVSGDPGSIDTPNYWQLSMWFKLNRIEGTQTIYTSYMGGGSIYIAWMEVRSDGSLWAHWTIDTGAARESVELATGLSAGTMYHLLVFDKVVYLNGVAVYPFPTSAYPQRAIGNRNLIIGARAYLNGDAPSDTQLIDPSYLEMEGSRGYYNLADMTVYEVTTFGVDTSELSGNQALLVMNNGRGMNVLKHNILSQVKHHYKFGASNYSEGNFIPVVGSIPMQLVQGSALSLSYSKRVGSHIY